MKNAAALIIAQDCAANALTLRAYAFLLAVDSPYVMEGRDPVAVDSLFAYKILCGKIAEALEPEFLDALAGEADALSAEAAVTLDTAVKAAIEPSTLAIQGITGEKKGATPTNGIVAALMLRCWREYHWSSRDTLDTPLGTLLLGMREAKVQDGMAVSFPQMALINEIQAGKAAQAETENAHA